MPVDPLYRQIARVNGWLSGNGYGYSEKRMVFDATLSSAGTLTELENFSLGKVPNREKLAKTLNAMRSPREAETYLHQLQIGGISDAQVAEALAFAAHNASEDKARVLALGLLPQLKADPAFIRGKLIGATYSPSKEIQIAASIGLLTLDHAQGQQSEPSVVADAAKLLQEDGIKQVLNPESMARLFEALSAHSALPAPLRQSLLAYVQNRPPNFISRKWHLAALRLLAKDNPQSPELLALLTKLAASRSAEARRSALETIAGLALPEQTKRSIFETALKDSSTQIRRLAAVELLKNDSAHSEAMDLMLKTLERNHPDFWIRAEAVRALRPFEASHPRVAAALLKAAHDVNPAVSKVARAGKEEETLPKPALPSRWEKSRAYRAACWASWRWLERRP